MDTYACKHLQKHLFDIVVLCSDNTKQDKVLHFQRPAAFLSVVFSLLAVAIH